MALRPWEAIPLCASSTPILGIQRHFGLTFRCQGVRVWCAWAEMHKIRQEIVSNAPILCGQMDCLYFYCRGAYKQDHTKGVGISHRVSQIQATRVATDSFVGVIRCTQTENQARGQKIVLRISNTPILGIQRDPCAVRVKTDQQASAIDNQ